MRDRRDRRFKRIHFESKATVMTGIESFEAPTDNISLNGLFVYTDRKLPDGERAEININVPSASRNPFLSIDCVVVRNDDHGLAFQFKRLDHDSFSYLKSVINRNSPKHQISLVNM